MTLWDEVSRLAEVRDKQLKNAGIKKLYRFFGKILAMPLICLGVSANFVTLLSTLSVMLAAYAFGMGHPIYGIILFYLGEALDYADGIVARYNKEGFTLYSASYLNRIYHMVSFAFIFTGIGVMIGEPSTGVIATMAQLMTSFLFLARTHGIPTKSKKDVDGFKELYNIGLNTKDRKKLYKWATIPMVRLKEITLLATILHVGGLNIFPLYLSMYGAFLVFRCIIFGYVSYQFVRELEYDKAKV